MCTSLRQVLSLLTFGAVLSLAHAAPGEPDPALKMSGPQLVRALQEGGYVIYFRHADTGPPYPEREPVDLQRCETQRNLNDHGRAQARDLGEQLRRLGIPVGDVLVSEFCRCWQTAEFAVGRYRKLPVLTGVSRDATSAEKREQAAAGLRELLATPPRSHTNAQPHQYDAGIAWL